MRKLLWVGDAGVPSGFAKATHEILAHLGKDYEITVLGINYRGDPHGYPYKIYAAAPGGDSLGVGRLVWMCDLVKPDVIVLQNDGWNIPAYVQQLRTKKSNGEYAFPEYVDVPIVGVIAIDGVNFRGAWLEGLTHAIFWTQFALDEARAGGYVGPATIIPLGVDASIFKPMAKQEARETRGIGMAGDAFIVGNVNRNQPRKRLDLTIKIFAEWVKSYDIKDAYLFFHVAPTGDMGTQLQQLATYYGIVERLILISPPVFYGVEEEDLAVTYNCFDVLLSTSQGEGFGLTALEAMACGKPCVLPDNAAFGDWANGAAYLVPCTSTGFGPPYLNVIGGVIDETLAISALDSFYHAPGRLASYAARGLALSQDPRYRWASIGQLYNETLRAVVTGEAEGPQSNPGPAPFVATTEPRAVKIGSLALVPPQPEGRGDIHA